ncbi:MAG: hypothetical protein KC609_18190 [Myxococcales bacterium]|nr:hypothetical protein [Myxococcales bacterium]
MIEALVAALDDPGSHVEEYDDRGTIVGAERRSVSDAAAQSLASYGSEALTRVISAALLGSDGAMRQLAFLVHRQSPDQLAELNVETRSLVTEWLEQGEYAEIGQRNEQERALAALRWIADEPIERVAAWSARLSHPDYEVQLQAIGDLSRCEADRDRVADTLASALLDGRLHYLAQSAAAGALVHVGGALSAAQTRALLGGLLDHTLLGAMPELLDVLAQQQHHAPEAIAEALVDWLVGEKRSLPLSRERWRRSRYAAARGLGRLGHLVPELRERLAPYYERARGDERALLSLALGNTADRPLG